MELYPDKNPLLLVAGEKAGYQEPLYNCIFCGVLFIAEFCILGYFYNNNILIVNKKKNHYKYLF